MYPNCWFPKIGVNWHKPQITSPTTPHQLYKQPIPNCSLALKNLQLRTGKQVKRDGTIDDASSRVDMVEIG